MQTLENPYLSQSQAIYETRLPIPGRQQGKVRDIYPIGDDKLLIVTTDRISTFDCVHPTPIPGKGIVLNQISLFWFKKLKEAGIVDNAIITDDVDKMNLPESCSPFLEKIRGRAILVHKAKPLPVECVIRGFLTGSGYVDYQKSGEVCGHPLPPDMQNCGELNPILFTPSTKAVTGHDENISFARMVELCDGNAELAGNVRDLTERIYTFGKKYAAEKGIIIADTKLEFGLLPDGRLVLIDEVLTPDSSRFWPQDGYTPGQQQNSLDKQRVRDHVQGLGWNKQYPAPSIEPAVVRQTTANYLNIFEILTGEALFEFNRPRVAIPAEYQVSDGVINLSGASFSLAPDNMTNSADATGKRYYPMFDRSKPCVAITMGSESDWDVMREAAKILKEFDVPYECKITSAHRTPELVDEYASTARERGIKYFIAGAGGSAHLPGMTAAQTTVPVHGVPVAREPLALSGEIALHSIVQMPPGIPVNTMGVGSSGAKNAALMVVQQLAVHYPELADKMEAYRRGLKEGVYRTNLKGVRAPGSNEIDPLWIIAK